MNHLELDVNIFMEYIDTKTIYGIASSTLQ